MNTTTDMQWHRVVVAIGHLPAHMVNTDKVYEQFTANEEKIETAVEDSRKKFISELLSSLTK